jgi:hypothetical protein
MDGSIPKVYTNAYGAKYLRRVATGEVPIDLQDLKISVNKEGIGISNLQGKNRISVYSISGSLVKQVETASESVTIPLNKGIYLVKAGSQVKKVIL